MNNNKMHNQESYVTLNTRIKRKHREHMRLQCYKREISQAEYIRQLIDKDIEEDPIKIVGILSKFRDKVVADMDKYKEINETSS